MQAAKNRGDALMLGMRPGGLFAAIASFENVDHGESTTIPGFFSLRALVTWDATKQAREAKDDGLSLMEL
jgi:hypothetical protein